MFQIQGKVCLYADTPSLFGSCRRVLFARSANNLGMGFLPALHIICMRLVRFGEHLRTRKTAERAREWSLRAQCQAGRIAIRFYEAHGIVVIRTSVFHEIVMKLHGSENSSLRVAVVFHNGITKLNCSPKRTAAGAKTSSCFDTPRATAASQRE
jgi:hypothetical protein